MPTCAPKILVEVVYALPDEQILVRLEVDEQTTARQAIERSGLVERFREIDLDAVAIGIFGKRVNHDRLLCNGDRVEIYRPLAVDPKARRVRQALARR
jgi:uncharacterized protein